MPTEKSEPVSGPSSGESQLWQVKFASGAGEQVWAATADAVRSKMAATYGKDYEITSVEKVVNP